MTLDATIMSGLFGASAVLIPGVAAFFVGWGSIHANLDALKMRVEGLESEMAAINALQKDVSYIRGLLDRRPHG